MSHESNTSLYTPSIAPVPPPKPKVDIEAMVKTKLPPLPGSVMRVSELLRDINVSSRKLAEAVSYDPSLTTRVLRLANSPIYALQKDVSTVLQAIEVIGMKSLYDIVMMSIAADSFANEIRNSVLGRTIWEHSLAVALVAKELSKIIRLRDAEEVFICGLLHDIGKIMLLRADVETYSQILEKKDELEMLNWEHSVFGYNHAQVGSLVVQRWRLPGDVCHTILNHHDASQTMQLLHMTHLINVADILANYYGYGLRLEDESTLLRSESAALLRLSQEQLHEAWDNIQDDLDEVIGTFR